VFDVIGGDIQRRSAGLVRAGGTLVSVVGPTEARPTDGLAVDFVVESDRAQLGEVVQRVRDGRLRTVIGNVATLDDAVAALNPTERRKGKTIISVVRTRGTATGPALLVDQCQPRGQGGEGPIGPPRIRDTKLNE
jgi:NADPH:quinone reductase-like Zn-dependent oxidoreductase